MSSVTYTELGKLKEAVEMNLQAVFVTASCQVYWTVFMGKRYQNSASRNDTIKGTNFQQRAFPQEHAVPQWKWCPPEAGASPWRLMSQEQAKPQWSYPATGDSPASSKV